MTDIKRVWVSLSVALLGIVIVIVLTPNFWSYVYDAIVTLWRPALRLTGFLMASLGIIFAIVYFQYHRDSDYDSQGNIKGITKEDVERAERKHARRTQDRY